MGKALVWGSHVLANFGNILRYRKKRLENLTSFNFGTCAPQFTRGMKLEEGAK